MISSKAKSVILRAYKTQREIGVVDLATERELLASHYMTYSTKPLLKLTYDGKAYARKEAGKHG